MHKQNLKCINLLSHISGIDKKNTSYYAVHEEKVRDMSLLKVVVRQTLFNHGLQQYKSL